MRSTTSDLIDFRLADGGPVGSMAFERNMLAGYQRLSNAVIIGESPNLGSGQWVWVRSNNICYLYQYWEIYLYSWKRYIS